jgi:hypothetical protein
MRHPMTSRSRWKAIERWWAEALGGKRVPVTGRQRGAAPDVEHPDFAIEVKAGKTISTRLQDGMEQAKASRDEQGTGQMPILCVSQTRKGNQGNINWIMLEVDEFLKLATKAGLTIPKESIGVNQRRESSQKD